MNRSATNLILRCKNLTWLPHGESNPRSTKKTFINALETHIWIYLRLTPYPLTVKS